MIKPFARITRLLFIGALLTGLAAPALAQMNGWQAPDQGGTASGRQSRLAPGSGALFLTRSEKGKPGDFILHITSNYGVSGCVKFGQMAYQMLFEDPILVIRPSSMSTDYSNLPSAPQYECSKQTSFPGAAIPLNTGALKDHQTTQIIFEGSGHRDYYNLMLDNNSIALTPSPRQPLAGMHYYPMKNDNVKNPLKLWFYPKNTVILKVAASKLGLDVAQQVDRLARSQDLKPLSEVLPEFTSPLEDPYSFYYVDRSKKPALANQPGIKDGILFGEIDLPATIYSPQGGNSANISVKVFAHTPGVNE